MEFIFYIFVYNYTGWQEWRTILELNATSFSAYLFSQKVEKTTLSRDNFFIVCGLNSIHYNLK